MTQFADRSRYEYKFKIPLDLIDDVRKFILPYTKFDPYLEKHGNQRYTVRSIYFDTPELDFYYEKIDGVKIRKKLRVRTYNRVSDFAFLENALQVFDVQTPGVKMASPGSACHREFP